MTAPPRKRRAPTNIRFSAAQLAWLHEQRQRRGLPVSTLVQLALEAAMAAEAAAGGQINPDRQGNG